MKKWTYDLCLEYALECSTKSEFINKYKTAYSAAKKYNWIDTICSHMPLTGNRYNKCIYSYEFPDNSVYVGLTYSIEDRQKNRDNRKNDSVTKYISETGLQPIRKQLTEYVPVDEAKILEGEYVNKYKLSGWNILNKVKTGAIGGCVVKWTKENCQKEALKYNTKADFRDESSSAYVTAKNRRWLNDICQHMIELKQPNGYWTKERCREVCIKYKKFSIFAKENQSCYTVVSRNGWQEELCSHMLNTKRASNDYYNIDVCRNIVKKCKNKEEFKKKYNGAYKYSIRHNFFNEITSHLNKPKIKITFDEAKEICFNYKNRCELYKDKPNIFRYCNKLNWLDKLLPIAKRTNYSFDMCLELCKPFKTITELRNNNVTIFNYCYKNNWLKKIFTKPAQICDYEYCRNYCNNIKNKTELKQHHKRIFNICENNCWVDEFFPNIKPNYNNEEFKNNCFIESKKYKSRSEFKHNSNFMYRKSVKFGWLDEFFPLKTRK